MAQLMPTLSCGDRHRQISLEQLCQQAGRQIDPGTLTAVQASAAVAATRATAFGTTAALCAVMGAAQQQQSSTQPGESARTRRRQLARPLMLPSLRPSDHLRGAADAIFELHKPQISADGRRITLSLRDAVQDMLFVHPPQEGTRTIAILCAADNAGFNHNGSKGAGGQTSMACRLKTRHGHCNGHKPMAAHIVAMWEGSDKWENAAETLPRCAHLCMQLLSLSCV